MVRTKHRQGRLSKKVSSRLTRGSFRDSSSRMRALPARPAANNNLAGADFSNRTVLIVLLLVIIASLGGLGLYVYAVENTAGRLSSNAAPAGEQQEIIQHLPASGQVSLTILNVSNTKG